MSTARKKQLKKSVSLLKNKSNRSDLYIKDIKIDNQSLLHKFVQDKLEDKSKMIKRKPKKVPKFDNALYEESKNKMKIEVINFIKDSSDEYTSYKSISRYLAKHYDEYQINVLRDCLIEMINKRELLTPKNESYLYKGDGKYYPKIGDLRSLKIKLSDIYYKDDEERLSISQSVKYLKIGKTAFYKIIREHKILPKVEFNRKTLTMEQLENIRKIDEKNKADKLIMQISENEDKKINDNSSLMSEVKSLKDLIIEDMERRKIVYKERSNNHEEIKEMIDKLANLLLMLQEHFTHIKSLSPESANKISITLNSSSVSELSNVVNSLLKKD